MYIVINTIPINIGWRSQVIDNMRFGNESELFGREKDDSFKGSIGNIYQSFGGRS